MTTIKDVAKKANVSTATVSRVLNGNYPVSKDTVDRVMKVVEELGYRPNAVARSLKCNKTYTIGMVVPDISNPYFMEIARGVESVISYLGYSLIFCSTDEDPEKELRLLQALNEKRVDFILLASTTQDASKLNELIMNGLPIIMIDTHLPGLHADCIVEDNFQATYRLLTHVIQQGHKKIGIINGVMTMSTAKERFEGFKQALKDYDLEFVESYTVDGGFYRQQAYEEVKKMIGRNRSNLPTALFATNNHMAEGTMIALKEMNLKIPDDISLVSFGDLSVPQLIEPRLTIIAQNAMTIGQKAGQVMIQRMEEDNKNMKFEQYIFPSEIIIRDSVKMIPTT